MSFKGSKSFNGCDVKIVEFKDFVYASGNSGREVLSPTPSEDTRMFAGNAAVLHCPRTEDDRVRIESQFTNHGSRKAALKSLRSIAGDIICRDCRFASMSPTEVAESRTALARAETERIEAFKLRAEVIAELEAADPDFKGVY